MQAADSAAVKWVKYQTNSLIAGGANAVELVPGRGLQETGAPEHLARKPGERHGRCFGKPDPALSSASVCNQGKIAGRQQVDSHGVVDLHDGVADGHDFFESGRTGGFESGQFPHAGHDGVRRGTLFEEDFGAGVAFADDEGARDFAAGHGSAFGCLVFAEGAAFGGPGANEALRIARRADSGAEFHDRLVEVAGPTRCDKACCELFHFAANGGFADRIVRLPPADTTEDALHVAIDYGYVLAMSNAGDGGSGVGADAGEFAEFVGGGRHHSGVLGDDGLRGFMQHAGAAVVA